MSCSAVMLFHNRFRISANNASLLGKWLYTVRFDTPAVAAILSMLVISKPLLRNSAIAAWRMASRFRSVRRCGTVMGIRRLRGENLHSAVYLLPGFMQSGNYTEWCRFSSDGYACMQRPSSVPQRRSAMATTSLELSHHDH